MSTQPLLALEETLERMSGDRQLLASLFQLFLDDAPKKLGGIDAWIAHGDLYQVERTAHSLKGSSATVGAVHLSRIAGQLEQAAKDGRVDEVSAMRRELGPICEQTLAAMREFTVPGA